MLAYISFHVYFLYFPIAISLTVKRNSVQKYIINTITKSIFIITLLN